MRYGRAVLADRHPTMPEGIHRLLETEAILIATGSELSLAVEAHEKLLAEGIRSRVGSSMIRRRFGRRR